MTDEQKKIIEGKNQTGVIAFGGAMTNEDHIQLHCKDAMVRGWHVVVEADHAKLYKALPAEAPIMVDLR